MAIVDALLTFKLGLTFREARQEARRRELSFSPCFSVRCVLSPSSQYVYITKYQIFLVYAMFFLNYLLIYYHYHLSFRSLRETEVTEKRSIEIYE